MKARGPLSTGRCTAGPILTHSAAARAPQAGDEEGKVPANIDCFNLVIETIEASDRFAAARLRRALDPGMHPKDDQGVLSGAGTGAEDGPKGAGRMSAF